MEVINNKYVCKHTFSGVHVGYKMATWLIPKDLDLYIDLDDHSFKHYLVS